VVRELPADFETPASVYLKLAGQQPSFLLESITGGENLARYSFIGVDLNEGFILEGQTFRFQGLDSQEVHHLEPGADLFEPLRAFMARYDLEDDERLPRFSGGLVGYLGYNAIQHIEPSVPISGAPDVPDAIFLAVNTLVAFDHAFGRLLLIANARINGDEIAALARADARLDAIEANLRQPLTPPDPQSVPAQADFRSNVGEEAFMAAVEQAKEHIRAGDIFQVVLSQRLSRETRAEPFDIYRALRRLNPSPYMFFFDFQQAATSEPFYVIGASPEMHVRLEDGIAALRPIAGTRQRGQNLAEDESLAVELLADPKERAEHIMLVDLGRNDLGRVSEYGSVAVRELMVIERYSHVMHIVSQVEGQLRAGLDGFDLLAATFPAGTVSGAPKIRAMQIINDLEGLNRGPYAGAVGYFSYDGSMDSCIAIRTLVMNGKRISVQAGAGIVADSHPAAEYQETMNKARALAEAVVLAEKGGSR
jgi:anthranilate synthase component 1